MSGNYVYGTTPENDRHYEIKIIRKIADDYLEKKDGVFISKHALSQINKRGIFIFDAINTISKGFFVELQTVPYEKKKKSNFQDVTVFYSGHEEKICSVNSVADMTQEIITLITVEHMDEEKWDICGDYISRKVEVR